MVVPGFAADAVAIAVKEVTVLAFKVLGDPAIPAGAGGPLEVVFN